MGHEARHSTGGTEQEAMDKLFRWKWPDGFVCPSCGHDGCYVIRTRRHPLYECHACRRQTSLTVGTIMEGSRTPLSKWFVAIELVARLTKGTTAVELAAVIEVTYKTAWLILHKIRHALGQYEDRRQLSSIVRMNRGIYGSPYNPTVYRHPQEHPLLAAAMLSDTDEILQLKIKAVAAEHCDGNSPLDRARKSFARQYIDGQAVLHGLKSSYATYRHPLVRKACAQAGKWLNAAYHGLGGKHLNAYLDEYCCRLNLALTPSTLSLASRIGTICARFGRFTYFSLVNKPYSRVPHPSVLIGMNRDRYAFAAFFPLRGSAIQSA